MFKCLLVVKVFSYNEYLNSKIKRTDFLRVFLFFLVIFGFSLETTSAQENFERAVTDANILGLSITNFGTIGKPDVRNNPEGGASMRYPISTGVEHMFEAGIWIGAQYNGAELRVSTSSITNPAGYSRGGAGFEFTANTGISRRSSDPTNEFFSVNAVSESDLITKFTDQRRDINGTPISGHINPLYADVRMESYNWGFTFTENFSLLKYDITNNSDLYSSPADWDSVYVGVYADIVVRNVNTTIETGGNFFNKGGLGYMDSLYTTYAFDAGSPDETINTYGAISILASEYNGNLFHPSNSEYLQQQGIPVPRVGPSYWLFGSGAGDFQRPTNDLDRYNRMAESFDYEGNEEILRTGGQSSAGNYISLISIGPYQKVRPGETISVYVLYSAALKPEEFQGQAGKAVDTEESRVNLVTTINSANSVFRGEDRNGNGILDSGEDLDGDGELTRYLFPTPPDNPRTKVVLEQGRVNIYWDRNSENSVDRVSGEQDFEGYRVYSSDLGDDINPKARLIREFDIAGNNIGFDTGFDEVELAQPVTFDGDPTEYWYKYEIDGLLSGWQYLISVTAFDRGDEVFGVESLETSTNVNAVRVFPGTPANSNFGEEGFEIGVYPNPYRINAAWDGGSEAERKINFFNLPAKSEIRIYTVAGDIVAELEHDAATYTGSSAWYSSRSDNPRIQPGGEHSWDLQSEANQILTSGLYLFTVKDLNTGKVQTGKLAIIK